MKTISVIIFTILISTDCFALKPCPGVEQLKNTLWVINAKLIVRDEKFKPFPNCSVQDRSECSMQDVSQLTFEVVSIEKGKLKASKLKLQAGICANLIPKQVGKSYKLFGNDERYFRFAEEIVKKDQDEILEK